MKRLVVFGVFFIALIAVSSCKKEVIEPNGYIESSDTDERVGPKKIGGLTPGSGLGSTNEDLGGYGDITDPNDDDYTRKPKKKN